jgi:potassium-transporting ATPase KdpC subunit
MSNLLSQLRISLAATVMFALLLCGVYPVVVWGISQVLFPYKANGSLMTSDGKIVGSELLAQQFSAAKYFHSRPSSAGEVGYDAASSGGSNLGPTSKKLIDSVKDRVATYRLENALSPDVAIPADAVTASASGLDPHISVKNALFQAPRVAKARGLSQNIVTEAVAAHTEGRVLGVFGEPRVNVLKLNLALDRRL